MKKYFKQMFYFSHCKTKLDDENQIYCETDNVNKTNLGCVTNAENVKVDSPKILRLTRLKY